MDTHPSQREILINELAESWKKLNVDIENFEIWSETAIGGDLWVDGYDSLRSTSFELNKSYATVFLEVHQAFRHLSPFNTFSLKDYLDTFDHVISYYSGDPERFWPMLAVGLAVINACGGVAISNPSHFICIINDSVMLLLSKSYRKIRFYAYNAGVILTVSPEREADWFHPELRKIHFGADYFIAGSINKIQHYNVNHDLSHIILFGDAYLPMSYSDADTFSLLLNAEEYCCGIDLMIMHELWFHRIDLHVIREFRGIEPDKQAMTDESIAEKVAQDPNKIKIYQRALKAVAQCESKATSKFARKVVAQASTVPSDLHEWISRNALTKHINGTIEIVSRNREPLYAALTKSISRNTDHHANLLRAITEDCVDNKSLLGIHCPQADEVLRTNAVAQNDVRRLTHEIILKLATMLANGADVIPRWRNHEIMAVLNEIVLNCVNRGVQEESFQISRFIVSHLSRKPFNLDYAHLPNDQI